MKKKKYFQTVLLKVSRIKDVEAVAIHGKAKSDRNRADVMLPAHKVQTFKVSNNRLTFRKYVVCALHTRAREIKTCTINIIIIRLGGDILRQGPILENGWLYRVILRLPSSTC